jgi:RNA polymerase sigma factor (sigma-70 family)
MDDLAAVFEAERGRLRSVALRMLGSAAEADDAVQEAWLRLARADGVDNAAAWLTTVVSRVCLDMLRSRASRREEPLGDTAPVGPDEPADQAALADSVGAALLVVLDTLSPAERLAFVLHDLFAVPFDEVGTILDRTPAAARQLASRARRRVQGTPAPADLARRRRIVEAFLAASREGDFAGLIALLDPDAVLVADPQALSMGAYGEVHGAEGVARRFSGAAKAALPRLLDGLPGLVFQLRGEPKVAMAFTFSADDRVTGIELIADLDGMEITTM